MTRWVRAFNKEGYSVVFQPHNIIFPKPDEYIAKALCCSVDYGLCVCPSPSRKQTEIIFCVLSRIVHSTWPPPGQNNSTNWYTHNMIMYRENRVYKNFVLLHCWLYYYDGDDDDDDYYYFNYYHYYIITDVPMKFSTTNCMHIPRRMEAK